MFAHASLESDSFPTHGLRAERRVKEVLVARALALPLGISGLLPQGRIMLCVTQRMRAEFRAWAMRATQHL